MQIKGLWLKEHCFLRELGRGVWGVTSLQGAHQAHLLRPPHPFPAKPGSELERGVDRLLQLWGAPSPLPPTSLRQQKSGDGVFLADRITLKQSTTWPILIPVPDPHVALTLTHILLHTHSPCATNKLLSLVTSASLSLPRNKPLTSPLF